MFGLILEGLMLFFEGSDIPAEIMPPSEIPLPEMDAFKMLEDEGVTINQEDLGLKINIR